MQLKPASLLLLIALLADPVLATSALAQQAQADVQVTAPKDQPRHPSEANGPKRVAWGVIRSVHCSFPTVIEFRLIGEGKPVMVYNNDFGKIDLTVVGYDFSSGVNPCKQFEGKKAEIHYAETSDKTVNGQVYSVKLVK